MWRLCIPTWDQLAYTKGRGHSGLPFLFPPLHSPWSCLLGTTVKTHPSLQCSHIHCQHLGPSHRLFPGQFLSITLSFHWASPPLLVPLVHFLHFIVYVKSWCSLRKEYSPAHCFWNKIQVTVPEISVCCLLLLAADRPPLNPICSVSRVTPPSFSENKLFKWEQKSLWSLCLELWLCLTSCYFPGPVTFFYLFAETSRCPRILAAFSHFCLPQSPSRLYFPCDCLPWLGISPLMCPFAVFTVNMMCLWGGGFPLKVLVKE